MRWIGIIALVLASASTLNCSLADTLENAPCEENEDCISPYTCVRTVHQASASLPGWCRSDGDCAPGAQEGCRTVDGTCQNSLTVAVDAANNMTYCCDANGSEPTARNGDGISAECVSCDPNGCNEQEDLIEECVEGDPRCVLFENSSCGCRVPDDQVEDSLCNDDEFCGEGFVCTRTLEQLEESQDPIDGALEPGWCRPDSAPTCVIGRQPGCQKESTTSCASGLLEQCAGPNCYCCGNPDSSQFDVRVYAESNTDNSAACIQCEDTCEPGTQPCTALDDNQTGDGCELIGGGPCGCTPPDM